MRSRYKSAHSLAWSTLRCSLRISLPHFTNFWRCCRYCFSVDSAADSTGCSWVNREWRSGGSVDKLVPMCSKSCPDWEDASFAVKTWLCLLDFSFRSLNLLSSADVDIAVGTSPEPLIFWGLFLAMLKMSSTVKSNATMARAGGFVLKIFPLVTYLLWHLAFALRCIGGKSPFLTIPFSKWPPNIRCH